MEGPCTDDEEQTEDQKLQLLLKNLENEWDFIKKRPDRTLYRTSSASCKTIRYSPGELMSSPFEETAWKVRTNDLAVEEILRERRSAIESGKLKGRRLFEDETEAGFGGNMVSCSGLDLGVGLVEVRSDFSYESDDNEDENWVPRKEHLPPPYPHCSYSSSSSLCASETLQKGSGTEMATMAESKTACGIGRLNVFKVCIAISLIVFIVGIISTGSFGVYEDEDLILTPT
ncbi:hypothetical protein HRI_003680300 [Hibiscus trionum]|uniref:Uncharacterized protein n=1 Tax=Hibiscus trionum TaxID=183268 RepID=A0A9W7IPX0_HIBTR|nr:hypothetical protein HRI_003680300 [Hibiscus trionum]